MESATRLAIHLDISMLQKRSVLVSEGTVPDALLPICTDLEGELGGRLLIKYIREGDSQLYSVLNGESHYSGPHSVTPTPIASRDLVEALALPPLPKPRRALLLEPSGLKSVRGPRRIIGGSGIEYLLEDGFSSSDIAQPGWGLVHR